MDRIQLLQKLSDMDGSSDYHIHSEYSGDGVHSVECILEQAVQAGIRSLSFADHDCTEGTELAMKIAGSYSVNVIPAVELTTFYHQRFIHILGYGFDLGKNSTLKSLIKSIKKRRMDNMDQILSKIERQGLHISQNEVLNMTGGRAPMVSSYAKVLLDDERNIDCEILKPYRKGGARGINGSINFAVDYMLAGGPLYVEELPVTMEEGIAAITASGGVAVIAHPGLWFQEEHLPVLKQLVRVGLIGMEVYTPYHTPAQTAYYKRIAEEHGLYLTHGSDFHGYAVKPKNRLGKFTV